MFVMLGLRGMSVTKNKFHNRKSVENQFPIAKSNLNWGCQLTIETENGALKLVIKPRKLYLKTFICESFQNYETENKNENENKILCCWKFIPSLIFLIFLRRFNPHD